jgi:hypothetical protein
MSPTTTTTSDGTSRRTRPEGPRLPSPAELRRATDRTRAVLADPAATAFDRYCAAELEMATAEAFARRRGSQVQADLENWRAGHASDSGPAA